MLTVNHFVVLKAVESHVQLILHTVKPVFVGGHCLPALVHMTLRLFFYNLHHLIIFAENVCWVEQTINITR